MKFDTPATTNPIDRLKVVGQPVNRIDGPLKTTGTAHYTYERHDVARDTVYGYIVGAAIAKGRIVSLDSRDAKAAPGVLGIVVEPFRADQGVEVGMESAGILCHRGQTLPTRPLA